MGWAEPFTGSIWLHLNGRCSWSTLFSSPPKPVSSCGWSSGAGGQAGEAVEAMWGLYQALQGQYPEAEDRAVTCVHPAASVDSAFTTAACWPTFFLLSLSFCLLFCSVLLFSALPCPWLQVGKNAFKNGHYAYTTSPASLSLCST